MAITDWPPSPSCDDVNFWVNFYVSQGYTRSPKNCPHPVSCTGPSTGGEVFGYRFTLAQSARVALAQLRIADDAIAGARAAVLRLAEEVEISLPNKEFLDTATKPFRDTEDWLVEEDTPNSARFRSQIEGKSATIRFVVTDGCAVQQA